MERQLNLTAAFLFNGFWRMIMIDDRAGSDSHRDYLINLVE
jgi:hypothetical protein